MRGNRQAARARRPAFVIALAFTLASAVPGLASACTLFAVPGPGDAELKVFFTRFESEDNTGGKYRKCRVVKKREKDSKTFFVTPFRQDANVVVHRENWPR